MRTRARHRRPSSPRLCLAFALAGLTFLAGAGTALAGPTGRASIVGGHGTTIAEYPALAYVLAEEPSGEGFSYTGTVVAPRVVLTAGHCVYDLESESFTPASEYRVITGVANVEQARPQDESTVQQALLNPGFNSSTLRGDAGLLILQTATAAPPLALAGTSDAGLLAKGTPISIAGWGETGRSASTPDLQAASTVIQGPNYCQQQVGRYSPFYSPAAQLCAISPPSFAVGTCHGDSGGPAIAYRADGSPVEVGITSFGEAGCATTFPDVFTRVDQVSAWAQSWIAASEGNAPAPASAAPVLKPPRLTFARARQYIAQGLGEDFRRNYRRGIAKRASCGRIAREKVKCDVSWYQGGNDYFGSVTIFYVIQRAAVFWNDRYRIHWVNDYCWFHSGQRQRCAVRTRTR